MARAKSAKLLLRTTGLNLVTAQDRLQHNMDSGLVELAKASNIDVSDSGDIVSRGGVEVKKAGSVSAMRCVGSFCLAVIDGVLTHIRADGVETALVSSTSPVCFADLPGRIYFCFRNGVKGFVEQDGVVHPWEFEAFYDAENRELTGPPSSIVLMAYYAGVLYVVVDDIVYGSEPLSPNVFCLSDSYIDFGEHVVDIFSCPDALYVATDCAVYAHTGVGNELVQRKISGVPTIPGSMVYVESFGSRGATGVLAATNDGLVLLSPNLATAIGRQKINSLVGTIAAAYQNKTHYYCALS